MADLKGSKTEKNLQDAFAGESQARNKYTYFAKVARKQGYEKVAAIFEETAENEREHAKLHFKKLSGIGSTEDNLKECIAGEHYEWDEMYPQMAADAREEGFKDIAVLFEGIAVIEKHHEERYKAVLKNIEDGTLFKKEKKVFWVCRKCGHIYEGNEPPEKCPVCSHPTGYFEILVNNF
ncbi:rubrerythrin [Planctomycetota bacterium]